MSGEVESIAVFLDMVRQRNLVGDTSLREAWREYDGLLQSKWQLVKKNPNKVAAITQSVKREAQTEAANLPREASNVAFHLHSIIEPGRTGELREYDAARRELTFLTRCYMSLNPKESNESLIAAINYTRSKGENSMASEAEEEYKYLKQIQQRVIDDPGVYQFEQQIEREGSSFVDYEFERPENRKLSLYHVIKNAAYAGFSSSDEMKKQFVILVHCDQIANRRQMSGTSSSSMNRKSVSRTSKQTDALTQLSDENEILRDKVREKEEELDEIINSNIDRGRLLHECRKTIAEQEKDITNLTQQVRVQKDKIEALSSRIRNISPQRKPKNEPSSASTSSSAHDDRQRKSMISDSFSAIYENEWKRALNSLNKSYDEEDSIQKLSDITKSVCRFCQRSAESQILIINDHLQFLATSPLKYASKDILGGSCEDHDLRSLSEKFSKDFLQSSAHASHKWLKKIYKDQGEFSYYTRNDESEDIRTFINKLIEVTWLMFTQTQPMKIEFTKNGDRVNSEHFDLYGKKGEKVKTSVWPAVFAHENGILISKGLVIAYS